MEVGSFLICRVVLLSPAPRQTPVFLVLRSGGQVFASLPCDDHGTFCEQFVFEGAVEDVSVELVLRRRWPFPDKRLEKGTFGVRALEPEVVCPLAVALGSMSLQMLLLRTTRRIEDVCKESDAVVEEDDFVVLPSLLLQEPKADVVAVVPEDPTIKSMSSFLGDLDLKCFVCKEECSKLWLDCMHVYCAKCLRDLALKECTCPGGECQPFPEWALRKVLQDEEMRVIEARRLELAMQVVGADESKVSCPKCGFVFLATDTAVSSKFRCRECLHGFCVTCGVSPFHDDLSCNQFAEILRAPKCRFCKIPLKVAGKCCDDCKEKLQISCSRIREDCGHVCSGVDGEKPCLKDCLICSEQGDEYCPICYCEDLRSQPVLQMDCGHKMHHLCWMKQVEAAYPRLRITFGHIRCPLCKQTLSCSSHPSVHEALSKWIALEKKVTAMALTRLGVEGRLREVGRTEKPEEYAMRLYSYYICRKCSNPYFAGLVVCGEGNEASERLCDDCAAPKSLGCKKHSPEFHTYKCRFCCNPASFKCWNTHSFCASCHTKQVNGDYLSRKPKDAFPVCPGAAQCPLRVNHPHVEEFFVSCSLCSSMKGF